jgi:hypothetical protein
MSAKKALFFQQEIPVDHRIEPTDVGKKGLVSLAAVATPDLAIDLGHDVT